jgi:hypothetical protein
MFVQQDPRDRKKGMIDSSIVTRGYIVAEFYPSFVGKKPFPEDIQISCPALLIYKIHPDAPMRIRSCGPNNVWIWPVNANPTQPLLRTKEDIVRDKSVFNMAAFIKLPFEEGENVFYSETGFVDIRYREYSKSPAMVKYISEGAGSVIDGSTACIRVGEVNIPSLISLHLFTWLIDMQKVICPYGQKVGIGGFFNIGFSQARKVKRKLVHLLEERFEESFHFPRH